MKQLLFLILGLLVQAQQGFAAYDGAYNVVTLAEVQDTQGNSYRGLVQTGSPRFSDGKLRQIKLKIQKGDGSTTEVAFSPKLKHQIIEIDPSSTVISLSVLAESHINPNELVIEVKRTIACSAPNEIKIPVKNIRKVELFFILDSEDLIQEAVEIWVGGRAYVKSETCLSYSAPEETTEGGDAGYHWEYHPGEDSPDEVVNAMAYYHLGQLLISTLNSNAKNSQWWTAPQQMNLAHVGGDVPPIFRPVAHAVVALKQRFDEANNKSNWTYQVCISKMADTMTDSSTRYNETVHRCWAESEAASPMPVRGLTELAKMLSSFEKRWHIWRVDEAYDWGLDFSGYRSSMLASLIRSRAQKEGKNSDFAFLEYVLFSSKYPTWDGAESLLENGPLNSESGEGLDSHNEHLELSPKGICRLVARKEFHDKIQNSIKQELSAKVQPVIKKKYKDFTEKYLKWPKASGFCDTLGDDPPFAPFS